MQTVSNLSSLAPVDTLHLLGRLGLSLLVGAAIGLNREREHKPAGLRTYMLVTFGTTILALLPLQLGVALESTDAFSRIIQGIITGVSFIGGGTILRDQDHVRGLTSAAAIWVTAALGLLIGCGLWQLGLASALICWVILRVVKQIEPL